MSRFQKNVDRILEVAQRSEISEFVLNTQYILFKRKKLRKEQWKDINNLIDGLKDLEFYQECAYWCERLLDITNTQSMTPIFGRLMLLYTLLGNYELERKYTNKICDENDGNIEKGFTGLLLIKLKKWNKALYYFQYNLRSMVELYNNRRIKTGTMLRWYKHLILCQKETGNFENAMKTIQQIEISKLDSMDSNDVISSCRQILTNLNEKPEFSFNDGKTTMENLFIISDICFLKHEIFKELGDLANCDKWKGVSLQIIRLIQMDLYSDNATKPLSLESDARYIDYFRYLSEMGLQKTIHASLAYYKIRPEDQSKRLHLFKLIFPQLFFEFQSPAFHIQKAVHDFETDPNLVRSKAKFNFQIVDILLIL